MRASRVPGGILRNTPLGLIMPLSTFALLMHVGWERSRHELERECYLDLYIGFSRSRTENYECWFLLHNEVHHNDNIPKIIELAVSTSSSYFSPLVSII